jgi:hypothetical protein
MCERAANYCSQIQDTRLASLNIVFSKQVLECWIKLSPKNEKYSNSFLVIVVDMGILKKVKEKTEEAAKKTASAAEKVGKEGVELGKKGTKKAKETAKKAKKKL